MSLPAEGLEPSFHDFRAAASPGPLLSGLQALDPDVVLVFRPEIIPPGLFNSLRALTIGYLTEPLPRRRGRGHRDLRARLDWLRQVDRHNFDRIISFDPLIGESAGTILPVWRSLPLPVDDGLFMDVSVRAHPPRLLFVGRSTAHRESILEPIKQRYPIVHIGHGLFEERLQRFLAEADVQLNLHNNPYPTFENRVCLALAAGQLVISEPLSPLHGLQPGCDHLEASDAASFLALIKELMDTPNAFLDIQGAGRQQAERFRASRVYPELIREAVNDVEKVGSERRRHPTQRG